jgi:hypothetical protein
MAMEGNLQQILERLLAGQEKKKANVNAQAEAQQDKVCAKADTCLERMLAFLRGLSTSEGGMTTTFKERSEKMDATRLEVNPEAAEAAVVQQELYK